jgi:hypothetical protein
MTHDILLDCIFFSSIIWPTKLPQPHFFPYIDITTTQHMALFRTFLSACRWTPRKSSSSNQKNETAIPRRREQVIPTYQNHHSQQDCTESPPLRRSDSDIHHPVVEEDILMMMEPPTPLTMVVVVCPEQQQFHCRTRILASEVQYSMVITVTKSWDQDLKTIPYWDRIGGELLLRKYVCVCYDGGSSDVVCYREFFVHKTL